MVGQSGLEPPTSRLSVVCSNQLSYWPIGGDERNRTADPLLARQVLYQLSYTPVASKTETYLVCALLFYQKRLRLSSKFLQKNKNYRQSHRLFNITSAPRYTEHSLY